MAMTLLTTLLKRLENDVKAERHGGAMKLFAIIAAGMMRRSQTAVLQEMRSRTEEAAIDWRERLTIAPHSEGPRVGQSGDPL